MQPDPNQPATPPTDPVPPTPTPTPSPDLTPTPADPPVTPSPFGPPISPLSSMNTPAPTSSPEPSGPISSIPPSPAPKSKKRLIIILAIVLALLLAGAAAAYFLLMPKGTNSTVNQNGSQDASSTPAGEKESIVATKGSELKELCNNKKISNAVAPEKPYVIAPYVSNDEIWAIFPINGNEDSFSLNLDEANVVACLLPDKATATAPQTCSVKNFETNETYDIQYSGISYTVSFYAAQTGEKLSESVVVADGSTCPVFSERKVLVYALPTQAEAEPVFNAFIAENA